MPNTLYAHAIARNLAELQRAIVNRSAMIAIEKEHATGLGFLQLAYLAMFNDYIAHSIKVFEENKRVASLWYLYRTDQHLVDAFAAEGKIDIASLSLVSAKLKHIRNRTHFHIDADAVLKTREVWKSADLKGQQLSNALDAAWRIVTHLQQHHSLPAVSIPSEFTLVRLQEQVGKCAKELTLE